MSDSLYDAFTNYIQSIVRGGDLRDFKSNSNVTYVLEHVNEGLGKQYYESIKKHTSFTIEQIRAYCQKNDTHGGGHKCNYGWITTSPSNFRYLLHAHIILTHMKRQGQNAIRVAEVGCGYGGLCLAITDFAPLYNVTIAEYHLIDLPDISSLQQLYLSKFPISTAVSFHSAYTYGSNISSSDLFLISNYCFSEISDEHQKQYLQQLFPKVSHGFMIWNHIVLYDIGRAVTTEEEYPLTSYCANPLLNNKYVYF